MLIRGVDLREERQSEGTARSVLGDRAEAIESFVSRCQPTLSAMPDRFFANKSKPKSGSSSKRSPLKRKRGEAVTDQPSRKKQKAVDEEVDSDAAVSLDDAF